jgi:hydroxylamine reductase
MFCYQCEQAAKGTGCDVSGVCGKKPDVASLQDLLTYLVQGLSQVAVEGWKAGVVDDKLNAFTAQALFATLTNVNFDPERFVEYINQCVDLRESLKDKIKSAGGNGDFPDGPATLNPAQSLNELVKQGEELKLFTQSPDDDTDVFSLKSLLIFGLRGVAAYADHAEILGKTDDAVYAFIHEAMAASARKDLTLDDALGLVLKCGEINMRAMELLDSGNTGTYGHPVPTSVPLGAIVGKAILISGHDLADMEELLKQTEGKGINIYSHGEMLPLHGYPELKKYPHFYGHYGTAWHNQKKEFAEFPGSILMTTNCIQKPPESYFQNIFTSGLVGWPGVKHISDRDFTPVIEKALEMEGFTQATNGKSVMVGFARNAVLGVADQIIEAVKNKDIRHFFLVGGCDGARKERSYYTEFVQKVPSDCVVLTLACGKFRFFDMDLGDIGGIPQLLDIGQCNDAYSAVQIALALANAFDCGVNDLPLSMIISWYEQKAVCILLTLLYLGVEDIRLGPTLPAFISPNILNVLVEKFALKPISTVDDDLQAILG